MPDVANTNGARAYRELNHRTAGEISVTLEWDSANDALRVVVVDREGTVAFPVSPQNASHAFAHPFVYA